MQKVSPSWKPKNHLLYLSFQDNHTFSLNFLPCYPSQKDKNLLSFRPRNLRWFLQHIRKRRIPLECLPKAAHPSPCQRLWTLGVERIFHAEWHDCDNWKRCNRKDHCIQISSVVRDSRIPLLVFLPNHTKTSRSNQNNCKCPPLCSCQHTYSATKVKRLMNFMQGFLKLSFLSLPVGY